ncbi:MAG: putative photosynthetic complex assembly protein PuhE [Hyphomicrobium sp.]|nr:putative photosynthetic complex assembly protein PuhE [Hyphomicrobium sp.]
MLVYGLPVLFVLFTWWFLTGAVLYVVGLPRTTVRWTIGAATLVAIAALAVLWQTSGDTSPGAAYAAFLAALLVWGWHEISFLTGLVTGPRTTEAPRILGGRAGLWPAIETLLYHELAILVTALGLFAMLWGSPNETGLWAFVILWVMRISAKLNVYLGVPNLTEEFLPPHLTYLKTYFCRRSMNLLFPVSVTLSTVGTFMLISEAGTLTGVFDKTAFTFLATLMALALIEHWFLVVPLPSAALWSWGLWSREDENAGETAAAPVLARASVAIQPDPPQRVSATIF